MRILNLYAGIGGNRKLWGDHDITAIEYNPEIAKIYQHFFPKDKVIVTDAHKYLEKHFDEFDFIWSSPPCPTHSKVRYIVANSEFSKINNQRPIFPSMILYEEILFLQSYFKGKYCVENVIAFYKPLISPLEMCAHWFWSNFIITSFETGKSRDHYGTLKSMGLRKGFDLSSLNGKFDKLLALRNCVEPEVGNHILNCAVDPPKLF